MSKSRPRNRRNCQAVIDITRQDSVWPELENSYESIAYYHLTDSLGRKWQTVGIHVTDAIQVFKMGEFRPWTYILETTLYQPDLTADGIIKVLNFDLKQEITDDMQIILDSPRRCNHFIQKLVDVNPQTVFTTLYDLKYEALREDPIPLSNFRERYTVNPVDALSRWYLENIDTLDFRKWERVGGSVKMVEEFKKSYPQLSFIEALEMAEKITRDKT
ncbi:hypothetical protein D3C75_647210 [compost metagenome]